MRGFIKKSLLPLGNRKALGVVDIMVDCLMMIVIAFGSFYVTAAMTHEGVTAKIDSIAASVHDAVSENRQLNSAIQTHYKDDIDGSLWYIGSYKIVYKTLDFSGGATKFTVLGTSDNGKDVGTHQILRGTIFRVEIISSDDTMLTRATQLFQGTAKARVVGYAEGSVD